ncbi:MAG: hypothetical protein KTV77_02915 [Wolbachia endosymbiont of Fragariocoptes setiger]|nr:hypothetical protein [Wolbachia endosymbiont of Fragariocoptes setiger]
MLRIIIAKNDAHVAEVLIKSGANLNLVDLKNKTPYNIAYERGNTKIIEIFNDTKTQLLNPPMLQLTNTQTTKVCKEKHNKCSIIM